MRNKLTLIFAWSLFFMFDVSHAQLNQNRPAILDEIGVDEKLGDTIPLDLRFADSNGDSVRLGDLIQSGKPLLLNPLYYECPSLCSLVLDRVFSAVEDMAWTPGEDYTIISFSIDPDEGPALAKETRDTYLGDLNRQGAEEGWHFLTGREDQIRQLTDAIGFRYKKDERTQEYVHLASVMMISPEGVITRYLYGTNFNEFDFRNGLYEAADGKIGTPVDQIVLYCFTYDPSSQSYVPVAMNIMKLGGLATVIILGIFLTVLWRREKGADRTSKIEFEK
ncbi:SCO family protein [Rhodohalobacter mucosus]|uniref:SCO family protein n=1 Tax=Rhodohalobacter mucosus TaxID=2079485 RepID=A0A316TXF8_9BACT|nr:SCO family protein [Rhodohalobacter mucosus]PWN07342.1 SCO family protein [Rhodohalobacter mucosus]